MLQILPTQPIKSIKYNYIPKINPAYRNDFCAFENPNIDKKVLVDVKGEVNTPGVYELTTNNTVIDAINKAGGLTKISDTSNINLSKKLEDEMVIIVY